jgi:hypothetical protein
MKRQLTFFINPFESKESNKIKLISNPTDWSDVLNYKFCDSVFYSVDKDQGQFIVDDDYLFHRSYQQTYAFKCNGGYHYILGDKSLFTIKTRKSPNKILKKLMGLILFPDNDSMNQRMISHVLIHNTNRIVIA